MSVKAKMSRRAFSRGTAPAVAQVPAGYSWETPPAPISAANIKEMVTTEVVIVGAGASGVCAALSAQLAGAKTVMLQKGPGVMTHGGFIGVIGSRLQKDAGVEIDANALINELMLWSGNKPNARLIRLWADRSGETMDWMLDMADPAEIQSFLLQTPAGPSWNKAPCAIGFAYKGAIDEKGMMGMVMEIEKRCVKASVDIRYNTPAVQLIREGKGRVTGVVARTEEGEYKQLNAKGRGALHRGLRDHPPRWWQNTAPGLPV